MKPQKVPHTCEVHPQTPAFISLVYSRANYCTYPQADYCTYPQADPQCPQNDARWTPFLSVLPTLSWSGACVCDKASRHDKEALGPDVEPRDGPRMHGALTPGPSVPMSGEELQKPSWVGGAGGNWTVLLSPRHRPPSP